MEKIAFFAPMKSPNHPVPSGDREMARGVMRALTRTDRDSVAELASETRCYDGRGDATVQARLIDAAQCEADKLIAQGGWSAWVTYHSYYKAPDLLGPVVSQALGIPYVLIEATRAAKRLGGPWDRFARLADASCEAADAIFYLTEQDYEGLQPYQKEDQPLVRLHPFLRREDLPATTRPRGPDLFCAGMMRQGDKLASYEILAAALAHLKAPDWTLRIAGDGAARPEVVALFSRFGDRVTFLGQLDSDQLQQAYADAAVFVWPGVNEAFGMVYLEAQAAGLPVVAQDRPGVRDVLPSAAMVPSAAPSLIAAEIDALLDTPAYWAMRATQARALVAERHLLGAARDRLWSVLGPLMREKP
ncbi:glycosyltransferase family 4 protein [Shimia sp. SDUM112013]|uniref:glycosyltransferase family 4 protein n=1 Tax=Shimia sp. SDUM112013 TaxID=3136160 RepID=UPI0032EEC125